MNIIDNVLCNLGSLDEELKIGDYVITLDPTDTVQKKYGQPWPGVITQINTVGNDKKYFVKALDFAWKWDYKIQNLKKISSSDALELSKTLISKIKGRSETVSIEPAQTTAPASVVPESTTPKVTTSSSWPFTTTQTVIGGVVVGGLVIGAIFLIKK